MAVSLSLLLPRPSSHIHVAFFRKWGGLVVMFLISVWWTVQLVIHTTISDFHINHNIQLQQHQRLLTTTTAAARSSPAHVVDSTSSFLEKQVAGDDASSFKMRQQVQEKQRIRDEKHHHSNGGDDASSTSKKDKKKVTLREIFEETHNPNDWQRIRKVVDSLRVPMPATPTLDVPYDIFNCPSDAPPLDYPHHWPMRKILAEWNPASVDMPTQIHQSLCIFDWDKDYDAIVKYREAEVPFIVENHPDLMRTSERWMSGQIHLQSNDNEQQQQQGEKQKKSYLEKMIGKDKQKAEHSDSNQFIYWKPTSQTRRDLTWKPPTREINLSYGDWYQRAMDLDKKAAATTNSTSHVSFEHWYFRVNAKGDEENPFLYDELPIFQPDQEYQDLHPKNNLFMVEPEHARGINCRFGMRGVLAAAHYDSQRNWVVLMGGQRRYILSHPRECPNLHLYPTGHSSARHSSVDWTNITTSYDDSNNETDDAILQDAKGTEVVLQAAHALYLPSFWFHFIVSLNINYQCNARSGRSYIDSDFIAECGFQVPTYEEEL